MEDLRNDLGLFRLIIVGLALLGAYLILLGVALAGLVTALKKQDERRPPTA
jgi:hypothetical protein